MVWHFNNDMPIYTQLIARIKLGIVSGEFPPGEKLSTVRDFAAEAGVNPNTMQRALQELEREGLVFTQRSSGRYVTEDVTAIDAAKTALAKLNIKEFLSSMRCIGYEKNEIIALLEGGEEEENNGNT